MPRHPVRIRASTKKCWKKRKHFPTMDGRNIFKNAVRRLPEVAGEALEKAGIPLESVDLFIPHQANLRINQAFAKALDLPESKVYNNIQRYGNTTAASIPLALDEAIEKGLVGIGKYRDVPGVGCRGDLGVGALPLCRLVQKWPIRFRRMVNINRIPIHHQDDSA
jgi:3-oxoacyl-[acyl-carrier-protein] synthase III